MGLLDLLNSEGGLLALGMLSEAAPRPGPRNFGGGLLSAMQPALQFRAQQDAKREREEDRGMRRQQFDMQQQQLQQQMAEAQRQAQRQRALEDLPGQFMRGGVRPETMDNRDVGLPGEPAIPPQQFDMAGYSNALFKYDPRTAIALQQSMQKDDSPISVAAGTTLLDRRTRQPIFTAPKEHEAPADWRLYQLSGAPQRGLSFDAWDQARRRAGAASTTVSLGSPVPVTLPDGTQALVQPANRPGEPPQIMRMPGSADPLRPKKEDKPLTEAQAKAAAFASQMTAAERELSGVPIDPTRLWQQVDVKLAGGPTNLIASQPAQRARQAQEQWAESYLRFKTGAASTEAEVRRNVQTFFPQPGDGADVVAQKARMRQQAMHDVSIAAGSGAPRAQPAGQPSLDDLLKKYGN